MGAWGVVGVCSGCRLERSCVCRKGGGMLRAFFMGDGLLRNCIYRLTDSGAAGWMGYPRGNGDRDCYIGQL